MSLFLSQGPRRSFAGASVVSLPGLAKGLVNINTSKSIHISHHARCNKIDRKSMIVATLSILIRSVTLKMVIFESFAHAFKLNEIRVFNFFESRAQVYS